MTLSPDASGHITPQQLKHWLHDGQEIALLDIREHGQYGEAHLFYAVNLPYSRLELDAPRLLPRPGVRIVVYDEADDGPARLAAAALKDCGYACVQILQGGARRWLGEGYRLFAGVHVPSKTFGELAELAFETPHISAQALKQRQDAGEKLVVLDGRPFSEYRKMNIPGGVCCPNGELALHSDQLIPDAETTVVVNCAGRTRSIIGAQTLIHLGLPNPVYALENGTQGWYLADQALEHGAERRYPDAVPADALPALRDRASRYAGQFPVQRITAQTLRQWQADADRTTYLCDVRTAEEYRAGTVPGAQHAPGGQLLQATDLYIGARGARIVVFDSENVRAPVVAGWLYLMGWDVCVLDDAPSLFAPQADRAPHAAAAQLPVVSLAQLAAQQAAGATLVDLRPSMEYRKAHIAGAVWSNRTLLADKAALGRAVNGPVLLLAPDADLAGLAARTMAAHGWQVAGVNTDGVQAWRQAGLDVVETPDSPPDSQCIDYLFFVHDRHAGNKQAARQYLAWETGLVAQIDAQERAAFRLPERA